MKHDAPWVGAIHEATHALVLMARGQKFEFVVFSAKPLYCPEADAMTGGFVMRVPSELQGEEITTEVLSILASFPAERLLCPHVTHFDQVSTTCQTDWRFAQEICEQFGWDVYGLLRIAEKLVRCHANSIFSVAAELQKRGRLIYPEVVELCPEVAAKGRVFLASQPTKILTKIQESLEPAY